MNPAEERRGSDLESLVSRMRGGDKEAWQAFGTRPRRFFCWRGLSGPDAEELAMDCAADIIMKLDRFEDRGEGSFAGWCYALARNRLADWRRRQAKHSAQPLDASRAEPAAPPQDTSIRGLQDAVCTGLESLSENDREIIELRHFEAGDSFGQIGQALGVSEGTARTRHHRALQRLGQPPRTSACGKGLRGDASRQSLGQYGGVERVLPARREVSSRVRGSQFLETPGRQMDRSRSGYDGSSNG